MNAFGHANLVLVWPDLVTFSDFDWKAEPCTVNVLTGKVRFANCEADAHIIHRSQGDVLLAPKSVVLHQNLLCFAMEPGPKL